MERGNETYDIQPWIREIDYDQIRFTLFGKLQKPRRIARGANRRTDRAGWARQATGIHEVVGEQKNGCHEDSLWQNPCRFLTLAISPRTVSDVPEFIPAELSHRAADAAIASLVSHPPLVPNKRNSI